MKSFILPILFVLGIYVECAGKDTANISAIVIYPPVHGTYQRYEIWVALPDTPVNFKSEIDGFLASPSWPLPNKNTIDPYDPKQVQVVAIFTSSSNQSYTRYGFFYQDVSVNGMVSILQPMTHIHSG